MAKRSTRRKRSSPTRNRTPVRVLIAAIIVTLFFLAGIAAALRRSPLSALPVPVLPQPEKLSGPLTLSHTGVSVLGAEVINPLDFIEGINLQRKQAGAPPLRLSTTLMKAAKLRVDTILKHQHFSHQDPFDGVELGTVLPNLGYHYVYATENIGMGGLSSADFVIGFMNSTSHRNNLLDPSLTETGAAVDDGPYGKWHVNVAVQLFAIPGGKDEYRGYTDADRALYERSLAAVNGTLNPFVWTVNMILKQPGYTEGRRADLLRQKQILETVTEKMKNDRRLESRDVAAILEYNSLL